MKKILLLLTLLTAVLMPSCNDDNTLDDSSITQRLAGRWQLIVTTGTDENERSLCYTYQFSGESFTYTEESFKSEGIQSEGYSVKGAWNVRSRTLQLNYDLSTLESLGYNTDMMRAIRRSLEDWNANLKELNKKGNSFGYKVSFVDVNGKTALQLNGINGYFYKISN